MRLSSPIARVVLSAALLAVAGPARGEDVLRALDGALAAMETPQGSAAIGGASAASPSALGEAIRELERRDAARRREFAAAEAHGLGGKAAQRLAGAKASYEAGHGRLLTLLRELARPATDAPAGVARGDAVAEAREILARIVKAGAAEPISAGDLSVRAPTLLPPALAERTAAASSGAAGAAATPGAQDTSIGTVPEILKAQAALLPSPVDVYEWVHNTVRPDFYYGAMKGPVETMLEQSGNDADTAALLVGLFRAKGVPARYVRGTVELPAAALQALAGTASPEQAVRVLARAGIPHEVVLGAGGIASVKVERIWAEVYLPYANYRGAMLDAQGKVWVPLDAGFRRLQAPTGLDVVREVGFDAREALDSYLEASQTRTPLEYTRDRVTSLLAERRPGTVYADVLNDPLPTVEALGLLPSSLPYKVVGAPEVSYDLPDTLGHTLRLVAEAQGTPLLDVTLPTADVLGRRLTLSYLPATEEDAAVAATYGGLASTPPYLVEVKPLIKSGGVAIAAGSGAIGMGVRFTLRMEFKTPGGTETVTNTAIAGNLTAIGLGGRAITGSEDQSQQAAQILSRLAWTYLDRWNHSDTELANLLRVVPVRPTVSACLVMSDIDVEYAGGDPLYPLTFDWRGIAIDADRRASAPVGIESIAEEKSFLLLSGLEGSILENRIFEDEVKVSSVSTAKGLGLAHEQGIEVVDVTAGNVDAVLPTLPFDAAVKDDIHQAALQGLLARVPAAAVTALTWHGAAYLLLDEETGEAAYQLQGGRSGGVTAPSVATFPAEVRDPLQRQDETAAPEGTDVAHVEAFGSTDFQDGTVNTALARPFKVLATDKDGFPVPKARVTFVVIGGGGSLVDPITGNTGADTLTVLSNTRGEAQATLVLGKRTDLIPRFIRFEGDEFSIQLGLNLVSARAGALAAPFTAFGFPDDQFDGKDRHATLAQVSPSPQIAVNNLHVTGPMWVSVSDPYGNPLSNIPVSFAFRAPAVAAPLPPGWVRSRDTTSTPGFVLKSQDYVACLARFVDPGWGDCAGQSLATVINSSTTGALAYAAIGDSPFSRYYFDIGSAASPQAVSIWFHTWGYLCPADQPLDTVCLIARPRTLVSSASRSVTVNSLGNLIEAYPLGADANAVFWADAILEKARIDKTIDADGKAHYFATGTNEYYRERLTDSTFDVQPATPGTRGSAAGHIGNGNYQSVMTMALVPQLNTIQATGKHYPPTVPYLPDKTNEVDPRYVDDATLTVTRIKDTSRPWTGRIDFSLWGVEAMLTTMNPTPVLLDRAGSVSRTSNVSQQILPDAYRQLLAPTQVLFELKKDAASVVSATGNSADPFVIPSGLPLPGGSLNASLTILGVSDAGSSISSQPFPVPVCELLDLETPTVVLAITHDPLNDASCGEDGTLKFDVCRDASVSLTIDGRDASGVVDDGLAPRLVKDVALRAGRHQIVLPAGLLGLVLEARAPFTLTAVDAVDPALREAADGDVLNAVRNRSVLPIGHTFVKGVDLLDGHVVELSTDLKVPGRHLGLEVSRTYSSAGRSPEGVMGAGWSFNYASSLNQGGCGLVTVVTADGSSQVFRSADNGFTFTPQKGYHTRLAKNANGSYDFTDKSGTRHHFREPEDPTRPDGPRRLEYIEEPHGDRIVMTYDGAGRVSKAAEVQAGTEVRSLVVTYASAGGSDRVAKVTAPGLALDVAYKYDTFGNLVEARRSGANVGGPAAAVWVRGYEYSTADGRDRHQLTAAVDPNGNRTEYAYLSTTDTFLGENAARLLQPKEEYAKEVREFPAPGITVSTRFAYDYTEGLALKFKTTVRDGRGNDTLYVLNGDGATIERREPLGKTTTTEWAAADVVKTRETDALGRVTEYGHDERGNLTLERIFSSDLGPIETQYGYEADFNRLTFKKDAEGRVTRYEIGPKGNLLSMTDAVGNVTRYDYDAEGRLLSVTDPRTHATVYSNHDDFGNARTLIDPLGNVTTREYDARGRLVHESDTFGHDTSTIFDGFDRPVSVTRVAGGASDPEVTQTEYYAAGEAKGVTNGLGVRTTFSLDGLSRVIKTAVVVGAQTLTTETTYDANGNRETEKDRRGVARRFTYDALNRLTKVEITSGVSGEGPTGIVATYGYDLVGNKRFETDVAGLQNDYELDGLYRVRRTLVPESGTSGRYFEECTYDRVGNKTSITDLNGHQSTMAYDGLNRLVRTENALGQVATATYADPEGSKVNKSEERDATRGLRTTFAYDALNRESERKRHLEGPGSSGEVYTTATSHDDRNHSFTVTDARGTRTETRLDGLDHPVSAVVDVDNLGLTTRTSYDGLGNRKEIFDPRNFRTQFTYDTLGRLIKMTDAVGHDMKYAYDGEGLKIAETDRRGVRRDFTYDNLGRPRKTTLLPSITGVGWSREVLYQDKARKRTEMDARRHATVFDLDGVGRVVRATDALGKSVLTRWDGVNRRENTDKRGNTTRFDYDDINRLVRMTDPIPFDSQTVETTYLDAQNQRSEKDRRGIVKLSQLDPLGRVKTVSRAGILLETSAYDPLGNKISAKDGEGKETRFAHDAANRLTARTDGAGSPDEATTTFQYDDNGNRTEERDARAASLGEPFSIKNTYDGLNRLLTIIDGEADVTTYGWDEESNRTSVHEAQGQEARYTYDELGKLLTVIQPAPVSGEPQPVTAHAYDENRNRVRQTDANGHVASMTYDELDRLTDTVQDPDGLALRTHHEYDENGSETLLTDPKGQKVTSAYDELNRVKAKSYAFAAGDLTRPWRHTTGMTYTYDANSNLRQVDESTVSGTDPPVILATTRDTDDLDRLTSETVTFPDTGERATVAYTYWNNGLRKTVTHPGGAVNFYDYDGQNRLKSAVTDFGTPSAKTTTHTYYPDDLPREVTSPNGVKETRTYDKADRLLAITNAKGGATVSAWTYTYDRNGNRVTEVETLGGATETTAYTYDDLNRLKTVTYPADAAFPAGRRVEYAYDPAGNQTSEITKDPASGATLASKTGAFDSVNRRTQLTDDIDPAKTITFAYDRNSNLASKTQGGLATTYSYDVRDTLMEVGQGPSVLGRFQYDAEGRLSKSIDDQALRRYVSDGGQILDEYNEVGVEAARYDYGQRLLRATLAGEGERYAGVDALGSPTALTDETGASRVSLHLDASGVFRNPAELDATGYRMAFTGYRWNKSVQLYYARARWYDPELRVFITQDSNTGDPFEPATLHRFAYGRLNPPRYVDPTGHATVTAGRIEDFAAADMATLGGYAPQERDVLNRGPAQSTTPSLQDQAAAARHLERLQQLAQSGSERYASITIEESDFAGTELDTAKVYAALEGHFGQFASAELPGLRKALQAQLRGAKAGESIDVSEIYNIAYDASRRRAEQAAAEASGKPPGSIPYDEALAALGGAAPRDLVADAQVRSVAGAVDVGLALYAGVGAARALWSAGRAAVSELWAGARAAEGEAAGIGPSSAWSKGPGPRGLDLEFGPPGQQLPKGFKTFDYFNPETGMATSQKSMDLLNSYTKPGDIVKTGERAINQIIDFEGYARSGVRLTPDQIKLRRLDITIPRGVVTDAQRAALGQVRGYGLDNGVIVRIIEVK